MVGPGLPFDDVIVWHSLRIQTHSLDDGSLTEPRRLMAVPPCESWPQGRCDSAIFIHDGTDSTRLPGVGLQGQSPLSHSKLDFSPCFQDSLSPRSD
jgi:hypothetical protein